MNLRRRAKTIQTFLHQRGEALCFDRIRDPRRRRGRRWSAQVLLSTAVLSLMMLAKSLRSAERLSEDLASGGRVKGLRRRVPDSTLGDYLSRLSPAPVRHHLHEHILAEHRRKALEPNWLYRVVNATLISSAAAVCIDQMPIPAPTNDMGVFSAFYLGLSRTYGRANLFELCSTDAGFTSEENARLVNDGGHGYWMALKGNQPELLREARRILIPQSLDEEPEAQTEWESDSTRGWIRRQLWRTTEMAGWGDWSHLRQVVLVRILQAPGPLHGRAPHQGPVHLLEERFHVTNLVRGRLDGDQLLKLDRAHWRIENDLDGTLDIQWEEDHGLWVQRKNGLPVTSLLRVLAYNLLVLLRAVHLRTVETRHVAWDALQRWMRDALVWPDLTERNEEAIPATL